MDFNQILQTVLIYALPVIYAITLREAVRSYVAYRLGDTTSWQSRHFSLNPVPYIDLFGTLLIPLAMYLLTNGAFLFGYAKAVPINFGNLRFPKRDMIWVSLAGPLANLVQGVLWGALLLILNFFDVTEPFFVRMCEGGILVNLVMFAFNLFPLPPMDGGRIVIGLLPHKQAYMFSRLEAWGFYILTALVLIGVVGKLWMRPLMGIGYVLINLVLSPLRLVLGV